MSADPLVVSDLSVTLHRGLEVVPALVDIGMTIHAGECVAVVGESGSGKSTLVLAAQGLLAAQARPIVTGRIAAAGVDVLRAPPPALRHLRRSALGCVFQNPMTSLDPTMTIFGQLAERGLDRAAAAEWLDKVGIDRPADRLRAYPHELSGGQQQRIMIALAMAPGPDLVVLDEPTTALDVTVQARVLRLIRDLRTQTRAGMLFVTHDLGVAAEVADRAVVLYRGRVVEEGPVTALLQRPAHPYTAALVGARLTLKTDRSRPLASLPPDRVLPGGGCAFKPRCAVAAAVCETAPRLEGVGNGMRAACHRPHAAMTAKSVVAGPRQPGPVVEPVLTLRAVAKSYPGPRSGWLGRKRPVVALQATDLMLARGETCAIVGESGSGKSTLLRIAAGLMEPDSGERTVASGVAAPQMVFQNAVASLTPWLTVGEQIGERLRTVVKDPAKRRARVEAALRRVGLAPALSDARAAQLSGGQCQRAAIARAIVEPPGLLLCDEPISALDVSLAAAILNLLSDLRSELGMAMLFVTHDLAAARYVADRVVVMRAGAIVEQGPADEVITTPQHPYTAELVAAVPGEVPVAA